MELSDVHHVIKRLCSGSRGVVDREHGRLVWLALSGCPPTESELSTLFPGNAASSPEEDFAARALAMMKDEKREESLVRSMFLALDTRGAGFLTVKELHACAAQICPSFTPATIQEMTRRMLAQADGDGDGRVTWRDFQTLYSQLKQHQEQRRHSSASS
eukprot:m.149957 g.149957  ORF g.149957 m.149957 type:complete len:159 (+) comp16870_c2_seq4:19-495(+)